MGSWGKHELLVYRHDLVVKWKGKNQVMGIISFMTLGIMIFRILLTTDCLWFPFLKINSSICSGKKGVSPSLSVPQIDLAISLRHEVQG